MTTTNAANLWNSDETTVSKTKTVTERFDSEGNLIERVTEEFEETVSNPQPKYPLPDYGKPPYLPLPVYPTTPYVTWYSTDTNESTGKGAYTINIQAPSLNPVEISKQVSDEISRVKIDELPLAQPSSRPCKGENGTCNC